MSVQAACDACGTAGLPEGLRLATEAEKAHGYTATIFDSDLEEVTVVPCVMCETGRALFVHGPDTATSIPVTDSFADAPDGAVVLFDDHIIRQRTGDRWDPLRFTA